jgi:hypothetical protein
MYTWMGKRGNGLFPVVETEQEIRQRGDVDMHGMCVSG